jgi:hypothetical protein
MDPIIDAVLVEQAEQRAQLREHILGCELKQDTILLEIKSHRTESALWRNTQDERMSKIESQMSRAWPQIDKATEFRKMQQHAWVIIGAVLTAAGVIWGFVGSHVVIAWH